MPNPTEADTDPDVEPRSYTHWERLSSQMVPGEFSQLASLCGWEQCWWKDFWCLAEDGQRPEWTFYPRFSNNIHTYHVGKQCCFKGVFLGNRRSLSERTVDKCLGKKKYGNVFHLDLHCATPENTPALWFCKPSIPWPGATLKGHHVTQVQPGS